MCQELEKKLMKNWWTKLKFKEYILIILGWVLMYKFVDKHLMIVKIYEVLPGREAGLISGMVWGVKNGLKGDIYNYLINTGLIHLVVVSGANLMIVGKMMIEILARYIGRKLAIIWGLGAILIYVNMVGWEIPVVRAWLFLSIFYTGQLLGRKFNVWRGILMVGFLMFLADFKVLSSVSFWLSMMAFIGVILSQKKNIFWVTVWVSIFILPILSMVFGRVSLITPLANMSVLFLVEVISILGFVGSIILLFWQGLGGLILQLSYPLLRYLIWVVEWMGRWEWGLLDFKFNWWMLVGWYLIIGGYWYEKKKT